LGDNGSVDGTKEYLLSLKDKTNAKQVKYFLSDKNLGIPGLKNELLRISEGSHIALFDDDIKTFPGWDLQIIEALDKVPKLSFVGLNVEPNKYPVSIVNGVRIRRKVGNIGGAVIAAKKETWGPNSKFGFLDCIAQYGLEDSLLWYRTNISKTFQAYVEGKAIHLDKDTDRAYRIEKNKAHTKKSPQLQEFARRRKVYVESNSFYCPYTPYDPDKDLLNYAKFTNDLILKDRK
jgi:glycosyltransferase involved in cell wall biosynthesis